MQECMFSFTTEIAHRTVQTASQLISSSNKLDHDAESPQFYKLFLQSWQPETEKTKRIDGIVFCSLILGSALP